MVVLGPSGGRVRAGEVVHGQCQAAENILVIPDPSTFVRDWDASGRFSRALVVLGCKEPYSDVRGRRGSRPGTPGCVCRSSASNGPPGRRSQAVRTREPREHGPNREGRRWPVRHHDRSDGAAAGGIGRRMAWPEVCGRMVPAATQAVTSAGVSSLIGVLVDAYVRNVRDRHKRRSGRFRRRNEPHDFNDWWDAYRGEACVCADLRHSGGEGGRKGKNRVRSTGAGASGATRRGLEHAGWPPKTSPRRRERRSGERPRRRVLGGRSACLKSVAVGPGRPGLLSGTSSRGGPRSGGSTAGWATPG